MNERPEWSQASNAYAWSAVLRNALPFFALLWLAPRLHAWSPAAAWLLAPWIGLFIYRITLVMHDCAHRTLFTGRRLNVAVGVLLGAFTGIDFRSFGRAHWRHHEIYGQRGDPQAFHYAGVKAMTRGQFAWHVAKPLLGFNLPRTLGESFLAPRNLAAAVRSGEIGIVIVAQAVILAIVTRGGSYPLLALLPAASAATFGLFFSQLRGIAEHVAVGAQAEAGNVRSHVPHWLGRVFLYDLNFNYHEEHHRYPQYPSVHLPAVHRDLFATRPAATRMLRTLVSIPATLPGYRA